MSNKNKLLRTNKLEVNSETLRQLDDLSTVQGGNDSVVVQVTRNNTGKGSWFLCCQKE